MMIKYEHNGMTWKIDLDALRRWWSSSWSNSASVQARDLIFFSALGFWAWRIIWDPFERPQMDLNGKNSLYGL